MVREMRAAFGVGLLLLAALTVPPVAWAQTGSLQSDSLRHYELSEIVIGDTTVSPAQPSPVLRVPLAEIVRMGAPDVAAAARLVPSAHAQTNSRGETLVYVRGAGERQVAVFFDGALLNVPWDNRVDLGLVPASVLGGIGVVNGGASVLYGTNTLGGAVLLSTRSLERTGSVTEVGLVGGTAGTRRIEAMHLVRRGSRSLLAAGGWSSVDGIPVPAGAELPYQASTDGLRPNTDRRLAHVFLRGSIDRAGRRLGVSVLHVDSEQGVAAEGHLDPAVESVRYWRYPLWRMTMLTVNGQADLGWAGRARMTVWGSRFRQRIDQYASSSYADLADRQDDRDGTLGLRMIVDRATGPGTLRLAVNALTSGHRQTEAGVDDAGTPVPEPEQRYRQHIWSTGAEYGLELAGRGRLLAGVSLDGLATPQTGDKPARDPQTAWSGTLGGVVDLPSEWALRASVGRKLRFPTPRELFGTALRRFLVNDDLRPESAWSAELGMDRVFTESSIHVTAFLRRTVDVIDQENVTVDGERLRRRVNLDGSRAVGVELFGRLEPEEGLELEGNVTVMDARVTGQAGRSRLVEKPDVLGTLTATWTARWGGAVTVQAVYTGRAWGLGTENELVALPRVLQVHARVAWRRYLRGSGLFTEIFVRGDNLTDALLLPQLGLPAAGRMFRAGVSLSF